MIRASFVAAYLFFPDLIYLIHKTLVLGEMDDIWQKSVNHCKIDLYKYSKDII